MNEKKTKENSDCGKKIWEAVVYSIN